MDALSLDPQGPSQADVPLKVLYGDTHPVAVRVGKRQTDVEGGTVLTPLLPGEAAATSCSLSVAGSSGADETARLRGGQAFTFARPQVQVGRGEASIAALCMQILADRGASVQLVVQCELSGHTVSSPLLHVELP